ncbi:hypothetical protein FANTH_11724 [Fusarium anthophilum]|uniref:Uncharacterized protein n=1 Tax=Fusarium anthophilum TaxID=48485 RepID=A0A8H5DTM6_9HYPO|nr:hypothetical protein FANTH_11724 [Fusarium anthophilum]
MENDNSDHTASNEYSLTRRDFFHEISTGDSQWRSTQAIFPSTDALGIVCEDISRHWGVRISVHEPFYPRLRDSEREMDLIMGKNPRPREPVVRPSQSQYSPAVFTPTQDGSLEIKDQKDSIQVANDTTHTSQPVPTSASDTLRNYDEELASIRSEFEQRLAKFQAQIQEDGAES